MYRASAAAPPRSGCSMGAALGGAALVGGGAALAPLPAAARTSDLVIRPPRAVPWTLERSMPSLAAIRRATGEAVPPSPGAEGVAGSAVAALPKDPTPSDVPESGAADWDGAAADWDGAPSDGDGAPTVIRAITCPTVTVSPSCARISV